MQGKLNTQADTLPRNSLVLAITAVSCTPTLADVEEMSWKRNDDTWPRVILYVESIYTRNLPRLVVPLAEFNPVNNVSYTQVNLEGKRKQQ